jgi:hypothetical protein
VQAVLPLQMLLLGAMAEFLIQTELLALMLY